MARITTLLEDLLVPSEWLPLPESTWNDDWYPVSVPSKEEIDVFFEECEHILHEDLMRIERDSGYTRQENTLEESITSCILFNENKAITAKDLVLYLKRNNIDTLKTDVNSVLYSLLGRKQIQRRSGRDNKPLWFF